jgi:hypothetical protein
MPTEDVKVGTQRAMFFELSGTELKPAAQGAALPELQNPVIMVRAAKHRPRGWPICSTISCLCAAVAVMAEHESTVVAL